MRFEIPARGIAALNMSVSGHDPVRELASVAAAFDAEAVAIEEVVAAQRGLDGVDTILGFPTVLVGEDSVRESLSIASGASIVHLKARPTSCGVSLCLVVQVGTALAVRTSLENHDERVTASRPTIQRKRQESFDRGAVEALVLERNGLGQLARTEQVAIRMGVFFALEVERGEIVDAVKRVGDATVSGE